jgi:site-specific DNA recombinase
MRGGFAARNSASHERPREEWIEIPVPALVSETAFDLAQERLQENKRLSPRRTVEWSIVQGLVSCSKCSYGMCRSSTRSSARKIHYYRCIGSDGWRHLNGPVCDNPPVRQDLLDHLVWSEILKLLEDPRLIQTEIERRLTAAKNSSPNKRREESLQRDLTRARKGMERLVTAYQETLLSLEELRTRMPELRRREQTLQAELKSITDQTNDRAVYLRLTETLASFLARLHSSAQTLDIAERQRIVRLLVKEVLVGDDTIIIRHSIPIPAAPSGNDTPPTSGRPPVADNASYLLRKGSNWRALRDAASAVFGLRGSLLPSSIVGFFHGAFQPHLDQMQHAPIHYASRERAHEISVRDAAEVVREVGVYDVQVASVQRLFRIDHRLLGIAAPPIDVLLGWKIGFEDRVEHQHRRCHAHPITQS